MKRMMLTMLVAATFLCCWMTILAGSSVESAQQEKEPFEQELWAYLQKVDYQESYSPWPGKKDDFYEGQAPHGALLKMYVNRYLTKNPDNPPYKSIIVKENYSEDKKLAAITVMYRVENYDADHFDWYWVKYLPDGSVAKKDDSKLAGKVEGCISCHDSAQGDDYLFSNDK